MENLTELCNKFKISNYDDLLNSTNFSMSTHNQVYKIKQNATCCECDYSADIYEDSECEKCCDGYLLYTTPIISIKNLSVARYVQNNKSTDSIYNYFELNCIYGNKNYYCTLIFNVKCVANKIVKCNNWYNATITIFDNVNERNDHFEKLI